MTLEIASVEMMGQTAALLAKLALFQFVIDSLRPTRLVTLG